ncbi:collagen alpha-1(XXI) chain-like [Orbicella faveolata]|uniref:collagen alpha-1(XXI) chain-like n=1 Tax=Orbicella faveolata TaxID=48498 RepID=UPI0009E4BA3C|nr:collagen alpha-1(XXI) chain-like [Orbicella faveolata]
MRLFAVTVFLSLLGALVCSESEFEDESLQNTGECPPMTRYTRCSIPVTHQCTVDVDCDKNEESEYKCCYNGCYMTCQAAIEPKSGKPRHKKRMCEKPMDLVFMIDSSESVGLENFNKIKKMVDKTLTLFTISEKKTHVGVIVIDSVPHIELNLNTLTGNNFTQDHVMKVVDSLQFISGQTRIDLALRMARKEVFSKSERKDAGKLLLAFTDGGQTWDRTMLNLQKEAQSLIKTGVEIFPVAVWSEMLNLKTLVDITHDSRNVFNTQFFPYLLDLLKKMSKRPCPGSLKKKLLRNITRKE